MSCIDLTIHWFVFLHLKGSRYPTYMKYIPKGLFHKLLKKLGTHKKCISQVGKDVIIANVS